MCLIRYPMSHQIKTIVRKEATNVVYGLGRKEMKVYPIIMFENRF